MKTFKTAAFAALGLVMSASQASALFFTFTGDTDFRDSDLQTAGVFDCPVGDGECDGTGTTTFSFTMKWDTDFPPDGDDDTYQPDGVSFTVTDNALGETYYSGWRTGALLGDIIEVTDAGDDSLTIEFKTESVFNNLTIGGLDATFKNFSIELEDTTGTVFDSGSPFPDPLLLGAFDNQEFKVQWTQPKTGGSSSSSSSSKAKGTALTIKGTLFSGLSIPAPPALPLLLIGALGVGLIRSRRQKAAF